MSRPFRAHRFAAFVVLIAATLWVGTGEISFVGSSEQADAKETAPVASKPEVEESFLRTVAAITPKYSDHAREIRVSGSTEPDKKAVLAARASGIISSLNIEKGQIIQAETVMMTLEGPELGAAISNAEIMLSQAERNLNVTEQLYENGNTSETKLIAGRGAVANAKAALSQTIAAADKLQLTVPFTGFVDQVNVEKGEWIQSGKPVASILALDPIVVKADVSELDIGYLKVGDKAEVWLVNGRRLEGTVRFVALDASPSTRTFRVEVALPNPDRLIPSGMTAEVRLSAAKVRSVTVPRSIITLSDAGDLGLRVVNADNIASFAMVELIDDTPAGLVLAGVPEGMRIIVSGQDLVKDGDKVMVTDATSGLIGEISQ
jgi:membrane fusion protein, multidrug efflux system